MLATDVHGRFDEVGYMQALVSLVVVLVVKMVVVKMVMVKMVETKQAA